MAIQTRKEGIHRNVWILSWVSFFTDMSSEMLYPIIPFFLTVTLGAPASVLGLAEGLAEAISAAVKGISGPVSDRIKKRKPMVISGYALSSFAKLVFALAPAWGIAVIGRLFERVGKGVRTPARDAIIAEVTDRQTRGRAFGFHRAMDTWGAVAGTMIAFVLLILVKNNFRSVMLIALAPAFIAVVLTLRIAEPSAGNQKRRDGVFSILMSPPQSPVYRKFVFAYAVFSFGASSATFLILWARNIEFSFAGALIPYMFANVVYASASEKMGRLSDSLGRKRVLLWGMMIFAASYAVIFFWASKAALFAALLLYGLYMAATEGIGKAFITDVVPRSEYGRSLGFFYFATGIASLIASLGAGILWDHVSPRAPFLQGACFGSAGALLLALLVGSPKTDSRV